MWQVRCHHAVLTHKSFHSAYAAHGREYCIQYSEKSFHSVPVSMRQTPSPFSIRYAMYIFTMCLLAKVHLWADHGHVKYSLLSYSSICWDPWHFLPQGDRFQITSVEIVFAPMSGAICGSKAYSLISYSKYKEFAVSGKLRELRAGGEKPST